MSFNCRQCNCACTTAGNLKRHMLTHSRAKPFGCSQCNNTHTTPQNLKMRNAHLFVQEKGISDVSSATILAIVLVISRITSPRTLEKNSFFWKQCNYTCSHSNSLMRHMLSHTGEKPFAWKFGYCQNFASLSLAEEKDFEDGRCIWVLQTRRICGKLNSLQPRS